jgi:hypothetical protein
MFDPANSAGLSSVAHQIPQVGAIIKKDREGTLTQEYVELLEHHLKAQLSLQDAWSKWYEIMDNPVKMAWTLLAANAAYFHVVLPNYMSGAFLDGQQAKAFADLLPRLAPHEQPPPEPFPDLLEAVGRRGRTGFPEYIPNLYGTVVNWDLYKANNGARPRYAARYFLLLTYMRWSLLRMVKPCVSREDIMLWSRHLTLGFADLGRGVALLVAPGKLLGRRPTPAHLQSPFPGDGAFLDFREHSRAVPATSSSIGQDLSAAAAAARAPGSGCPAGASGV